MHGMFIYSHLQWNFADDADVTRYINVYTQGLRHILDSYRQEKNLQVP